MSQIARLRGTRRIAIVHIGLEKTGSTTLQHWLALHRGALRREGVFVPASLGSPNQTRLVTACLDDDAVDNIKAHQMAAEARSAPALRARMAEDFAAEMATAGPWSRLVVTSELLSSRLLATAEVERLAEFLAPHVEAIRVVVVLRRQADLALSRYSSALRAGLDRFDAVFDDLSPLAFRRLPAGREASDLRAYFDYDAILRRFEPIAAGGISLHVYGPGFDPVAMMVAELGLTQAPLAASPALNAAMGRDAQYLIAALNRDNRVQFPSGLRNTAYQALLRRVEESVKGPPRQVDRATAEAFQSQFDHGNAALADRLCEGRPLFPPGFAAFPDQVAGEDLSRLLAEPLAALRAEAARLPRHEPPLRRALRPLRRAAADLGLR
jgi:hypothetical protein